MLFPQQCLSPEVKATRWRGPRGGAGQAFRCLWGTRSSEPPPPPPPFWAKALETGPAEIQKRVRTGVADVQPRG